MSKSTVEPYRDVKVNGKDESFIMRDIGGVPSSSVEVCCTTKFTEHQAAVVVDALNQASTQSWKNAFSVMRSYCKHKVEDV
jgi:hypothetical protein